MGRGDIGKQWEGHAAKTLIERCICLDFGALKPEKTLREHPQVQGRMTLGNKAKGIWRYVEFWMDRGRLFLKGPFGGAGLEEHHEFALVFHRVQWFIVCPKCGKRSRKLYSLGSGVFWEGQGFPIECRDCHRLQYRSQTWPAEKERRRQARVFVSVFKWSRR